MQLDAVVPEPLIEDLRRDLATAYAHCHALQAERGLLERAAGTVHHVLGLGASFLSFLDGGYGLDVVKDRLEGQVIVNSFGGVMNEPSSRSYVHEMHRDVRRFSDQCWMVNMLVMLDEFTLENGTTYLYTGSHRLPERPAPEEFQARADRPLGRAGGAVIWDSRLWHAAGENRSGALRRALTLTFTRPSLKQQLDYPRLLGYERLPELSPRLRQLLGYNARVPASLDEWYQPPESRFYKSDQG